MTLKANAAGLAIGAGAILIGLAYAKRGSIVASAGQAVSNVDGTLTDAVLQIPGASALTDPVTGDFNPVAAGQAAGQATRDWLGQQWTGVQNWWDDVTGNAVDLGKGPGW
ncbi:hypothetical protein [Burkholderia sp. IMCC1007]|uniref:hypothetical protein n=1 Tax=Burkholderia sp. IMCC1007 TaxID=3004104 RepID=UPI0022B3A70D|nr:hypothetical protein [Burkholderia sp. IMCC1007]